MQVDRSRLETLYRARLEDLKEVAGDLDLPRTGNVEQLRARLIAETVLSEIDLSTAGIKTLANKELSDILAIFGIKKSDSKKRKMQRLYLHLNHDPKKLMVENLADMTRDDLHALCVALDLPRSGSKNQLLGRVAGVVSAEQGSWGKIKKSLKKAKKAATPAPAPTPAPTPEPVPEVVSQPVEEEEGETPQLITLDEGAGEALVRLESRKAELTSHLREFLLIGRDQDEGDIAAFIEDLGRHGFGIEHAIVRDRILGELDEMVTRKQDEESARSALPGSWREKQALRSLEDARPKLLNVLDEILARDGEDVARARMAFEAAAIEAGLDLDLPAISGRIHGLFDLQVSLLTSEQEADPVTARRQRALEILYRGTHDASSEAMALLGKIENQMEAFERVVETIVRRSNGEFTPVEHALLVRFLERRGWDANHPEVRPRMLAAAGVLAAEMGYVSPDDVPALPTSLSLDPDRVSDVVDSMREVLQDMGRTPPSVEQIIAADDDGEADRERVRDKLDAADALLRRLNRGETD